MHIQHFSKPSPLKRECEDAIVLNASSRLYGVMDGVTPVADYRDADGHNGAFLAANLFRRCLEQADGSREPEEEIKAANRELGRAMLAAGIDPAIRHELWSSCAAIALVKADRVGYAQLGDCMAVARYTDGTVEVLTENRVKGVSERARLKRERDRRGGKPVEDESRFADLRSAIVYNRSEMANTPEGYGVANGQPEAEAHIQSGSVPLEGLAGLLLVSDGMFHPELPLAATMELILREGFEAYVGLVEAAEREKRISPDDRSAVLLSW